MARKISLNQETKKYTEKIKMPQRKRKLCVVERNSKKCLEKYTFWVSSMKNSVYGGLIQLLTNSLETIVTSEYLSISYLHSIVISFIIYALIWYFDKYINEN